MLAHAAVDEVRPDYTMEQPWARYSAADHAIWRRLFERQYEVLQGRAVQAFGTERDDRVPVGVEKALRTDGAVSLPVPGAEARGVDVYVDA